MANAKELLEKYRNSTCTEAEKQMVEQWWLHYRAGEPTDLPEEREQQLLHEMETFIRHQTTTKKLNPRLRWHYAAAAILLVVIATAFYFKKSLFVIHNSGNLSASGVIVNQEIQPGYNQATLTLADGTKVALDSAKTGIQIKDEAIHYNDGTKIKALIHHSSFITYNLLTTPKGGQYQVILDDGTKVWLNAASTLKYPSQFSEDKREVFLEGEAYFEVNNRTEGTRDRKSISPFIVKTNNQSITVLGTSFNVFAYTDEPTVKTTLDNGAVKVQHSTGAPIILRMHGEQTVLNGNQLSKVHADADAVTAWKKGYLSFEGKSVTEVMSNLSRWYDVQVSYEGSIPNILFGGELKRNARLSTVINFFNKAGLRVTITGRQLTVHGNQKSKSYEENTNITPVTK